MKNINASNQGTKHITTVMNQEFGYENQPQAKPVIFIAFANDKVNHTNYLRNLAIEYRGIRNALDRARRKGLCEVVERISVTIEDIFDVFQDETYRDRIAVFHYGGHADCYQLLLETPDGRHAYASRGGLVPFFARQKSLRLVFLNACSTQQHALALKLEGIPAVIGTSQRIKDEVATGLAIRFYHGIANGFCLEGAWRDAEDYIKTKAGLSNFDDMYHWGQQKKHEDSFPWNIFFKEGAEEVKEWNLPAAANEPLFGLPAIPNTHNLPDFPYLFLNRYERRHAEIFFGRSHYIRKLYNCVTDKNTAPIILMNGQSGVGKSSLLEAGLLPRLEESHTIIYTRRLQEKGLLGTLEEALNNQLLSLKKDNKHSTIGEKWKLIISEIGKPLVIILDQVEQVYTHENKKIPHEFEDFTATLKTLFKNPENYPDGKLVLVYRKEYHPEIETLFKNCELERTSFFLQPLNRHDIIEVVNGLTRTQRFKDKYNLHVEDQLPNIIANDILKDRESPVASTLQILLTKMWERSPDCKFTIERYQFLKTQGLLMEDFFKQQMKELQKWKNEVIDSGLALDVLNFHTTELGTGCSRDIEEIQQTYQHCGDIIPDLVKQLKSLYLLTDTQQGESETSLIHDTLAPIVIKEYNASEKPGQRASRIIAARIEDFKENPNEVWLNEIDLGIIERGKKGMRILSSKEEELVEKSRTRIAGDKFIKIIFKIIILVLSTLIALVAWQWNVSLYKEKVRKISKANQLVFLAQSNVESDPTIAVRLAEAACNLDQSDIARETIYKIYRENNFYKIIETQQGSITSVSVSPNGRFIITSSLDGTARLWGLDGTKLQDFKGHTDGVNSAAFSPDSTKIITSSRDRTARLWNLDGTKLQDFKAHNDWINSAVFSPDGTKIVTVSVDRTARLWDLDGNQLLIFDEHRGEVTSVAFSPGGEYILTGSEDKSARLWDLGGNQIWDFSGDDNSIHSVAFSPDGKYILTGSADGGVRLWDFKGKELLVAFIVHRDRVNSVAFSSDSKYIITASCDKTARLLDLELNEIQVFKGHEHFINSVVFLDNDQYILTGAEDKTSRLWKIRPYCFRGWVRWLVDFLKNGICCETLNEEQRQRYGIKH
jgi:WD40 repeat protein